MPLRAKDSSTDQVFGALANPTRRDVLDLLLHGPRTVSDIASRFDMARPSVSEHLKVLRDTGLVTETKRGRHRYYAVNPGPLYELRQWLTPYERFWRDRLASMGDVLDELGDKERRKVREP
ncbi:DNA-binding transcriptional regulator, ArsR family [Amycolatopsis arida]|uniref:DNA-binding transcriptional regulator, ArsR family n=1 Tax=Amycolatopsis arida TaxID=587909 RepID=A0A1I5LB43_9PSEU|nr:metalloregulator ArsR/SmtB family transcription factor [Amycolatopsis arida]TDX93653.1 DNA-binding transcriptional ArsR family regulator [Amycolatopsis arida]SFO94382.1 DNA-binding transcriptional regulator, ArsR family [Amycolatopsis arida]